MEWRGDFQWPLLERERVEFFMRKPLIYTLLLGRDHWSQPRQLRWLWQPLGQQADGSGGEFQTHAFGLFDMLGNVLEWTCSQYKESYGGSEQECSVSAGKYSHRGGSWYDHPRYVRSADRYDSLGFRLAQD